jgi:hypothetical protein
MAKKQRKTRKNRKQKKGGYSLNLSKRKSNKSKSRSNSKLQKLINENLDEMRKL